MKLVVFFIMMMTTQMIVVNYQTDDFTVCSLTLRLQTKEWLQIACESILLTFAYSHGVLHSPGNTSTVKEKRKRNLVPAFLDALASLAFKLSVTE